MMPGLRGSRAAVRSPEQLRRDLARARADIEELEARVAAGTVNADALAVAEYRVAMLGKALARCRAGTGDVAA